MIIALISLTVNNDLAEVSNRVDASTLGEFILIPSTGIVAPSDGYAIIGLNYATTGYINLTLDGIPVLSVNNNGTAITNPNASIFVKKGTLMTCSATNLDISNHRFYSIS